jgi:ribosomal protein S18 acetylase RimI-like enzyme
MSPMWSSDSRSIVIQRGFAEEQRAQAARLFDAAFEAKLSLAFPQKHVRLAVLRESFNPEFCLVAMRGPRLVGIAGFKTPEGSFTGGITFKTLRVRLGVLDALRAIVVLSIFERSLTSGELLLDGISVSPRLRSQGVGSMLLRHVVAFGQTQGHTSVRLDVVDTNPAARRLYERLGFVPKRTVRFGYLRWLLGFSAATTLEFSL